MVDETYMHGMCVRKDFLYATLLRSKTKREGNNKMQQLNEPAKLCILSGKANPVDNNLTGAVCREERERGKPLAAQISSP